MSLLAVIGVTLLLLLFPGQGLILAWWGTTWSGRFVSTDCLNVATVVKVYLRLLLWGLIPIVGICLVFLIVKVNQAPLIWFDEDYEESQTTA